MYNQIVILSSLGVDALVPSDGPVSIIKGICDNPSYSCQYAYVIIMKDKGDGT